VLAGKIAQLVEMGFESDAAAAALDANSGDVEAALNSLFASG
jgi:uncharacterized UBP type Zn finger protein